MIAKIDVELVRGLIERGIEYAENPVAFSQEELVVRGQNWLREQAQMVEVVRVLRHTGPKAYIDRTLEMSVSKDTPKDYGFECRVEEISREMK